MILTMGRNGHEISEHEATFLAVAYRLNSKDRCTAPGFLCQYCPLKKCTRIDAMLYTREHMIIDALGL